MFRRSSRKKPSSLSGVFRAAPDQEERPAGDRWFEALVIGLSFVVIVAAITKFPTFTKQQVGYDIDSQPVALEEVRAERYFEAEDLQATREKRDQAAADVPDTYRIDGERVRIQLLQLQERVGALTAKRDEVAEALREAFDASAPGQSEFEVASKAMAAYAAKLKETPEFGAFPDAEVLSVWLMPTPGSIPKWRPEEPPAGALEGASAEAGPGGQHPEDGTGAEAQRPPELELMDPEVSPLEFAYAEDLSRLARQSLEYVLRYGVIAPEDVEGDATRTIMILREDPVGDQMVSDELPIGAVPAPAQAEEKLSGAIAEAVRDIAGKESERPTDLTQLQRAAFELAKPLIADTVFFDRVYTAGAREQKRMAVDPVMKEIMRELVIQRSGDKWTAQSRSDARTYWRMLESEREPAGRVLAIVVAHMIFVGLALTCLSRSIVLLTPKREERRRNLYLALLLTGSTLVLGRVAFYFEPTGFVVPAAAAGILLAILLNARIAVITSFLIAALVSAQYGYSWRLLVVESAMAVAGVFAIRAVRRRSDMTAAAVAATVAGLLAMAALTLAMESLLAGPALRRLFLVLINGGMCLFIVPGALSPLERLFRITTDIQLLEYSDFNNEVLSRMAIEVPATYAHCLMLGQLAEAAADAVGANGLLARVCAYYHDIGKLRRPQYFSENQQGANIHDGLTPRTSARAVAAHVTQGVELGREYHLPRPVIDAILEHHGTSLIGFFYQQALEQDKHDAVREEDFRYPGPKPQSRETAILMICDAVESGVRSIKNPNEERVRDFVDKIIQSRSADRQFDECNLTLKDLDVIKEVVTQRMVTALHTRIAYPDKEPEASVDNVVTMSGGKQ